MSDFQLYLQLGFEHILDLNGRDHILFLVAMLIIYRIRDWKAILWIVTSFTIAHTISLFLATLNLVSLPAQFTEILIALTILLAAVENIFNIKTKKYRLFFSGVFGLIHGLGFSNYLKALLGKESDILLPLFSFNLGVELGQLVIVVIMISILWLIHRFFKIKQKTMVLVISSLIAIQSLLWILLRSNMLSKNDIPHFLHFIVL